MVEDVGATVCCMCGDVGFSDKLFRCSNCRNRFQHSYCSNYYSENRKAIEVCNWCEREEKNLWSSRNFSKAANANEVRSVYSFSGVKIEQHAGAAKVTGKAPSPRPTTRRYKLLKDVKC